MFSTQKEYVFDAKRGSFCTKKSLFFFKLNIHFQWMPVKNK